MGIVNFSPKQDGTGDPSPTNVRPIHPGLVLKSKNLLNPTVYNFAYNDVVVSKDTYRAMWCKIPKSGTYTISRDSVSGNRFRVYECINEPAVGEKLVPIFSEDTALNYTFNTSDGFNYLFVYLANDGSTITSNIQLELGSTPTEYEPYYDMEIYGGYVDFENAEVVETHKAIVNLGELAYASDERQSLGRFSTAVISGIDTTGSARTAFCLTSCYESKTNGEAFDANWNYVAYCSASRLYIHDHRFTTASDLKAALVDQTLVYKVTTPTTYSLTASQLTQAYNQLVPVSPIMLARRRRIMMQRNPNILYEAWNLSFNGVDKYIDTGVYLFTQENINRDFEFIAEGIAASGSKPNNTIICAKHDSNAYGFLVRIENSTSADYNGTIKVWPTPGSIVIRRINGVITLNGTNIHNPSVQFTNGVFDWPLVLGCAIDDNGNLYRYRKGTIDHVCVRWL